MVRHGCHSHVASNINVISVIVLRHSIRRIWFWTGNFQFLLLFISCFFFWRGNPTSWFHSSYFSVFESYSSYIWWKVPVIGWRNRRISISDYTNRRTKTTIQISYLFNHVCRLQIFNRGEMVLLNGFGFHYSTKKNGIVCERHLGDNMWQMFWAI